MWILILVVNVNKSYIFVRKLYIKCYNIDLGTTPTTPRNEIVLWVSFHERQTSGSVGRLRSQLRYKSDLRWVLIHTIDSVRNYTLYKKPACVKTLFGQYSSQLLKSSFICSPAANLNQHIFAESIHVCKKLITNLMWWIYYKANWFHVAVL